jgi:hypothetical protein
VTRDGCEGHHRADVEGSLVHADLGEAGYSVQRHHALRGHEAESQCGHQGSAARDDAHLSVRLRQDLHRLGDALGLGQREGPQADQ